MLRRRLGVSGVLLVGALVAVLWPVSSSALSSAACPFADSETATECVVSGAWSPGAGPHVFSKTLHVTGTGSIDGSATGIALSVTGDLILDAGAVIEADDDNVATGNTGASDISISVTGSLVMAAGSRISADNNVQGGDGGDIVITVGGDMSMAGTAGTGSCRTSPSQGDGRAFYNYGTFGTPDVYYTASLGARISSHRYGASSSASGGHVTVTVGNYGVPPSGLLTMERCSLIDVSSRGSAGEIDLTAGKKADLDGLVLSESGMSGTGAGQPRGGGPIDARAGCELVVSDTGVISSKGQDPGADLVHLKGCDVLVQGVVQSTAPAAGHVLPVNPPNLCNSDQAAHPPGLASGFTGCVRILGQKVVIDATGTHNGNVNVDGIQAPMKGWIDIFATEDITILGDPAPALKWAVSANGAGSTNTFGGVITIKALGTVATSGQAVLQANALGGGSDGGLVTIQAADDVALEGSYIEAKPPGAGSNTIGGTIRIRSFNGAITSGGDMTGHIDASTGLTPGSIALTECSLVDSYLGTVTPAATETRGSCGGAPTFPADAQALLDANAPIWAACGQQQRFIISGLKFHDVNGDRVNAADPGDPGLGGWTIHLYNADGSIHLTTVTAPDGSFSFLAPNGSYTVCEQLQPGWSQTAPQAGANCLAPGDPAGDNPTPGPVGYTIVVNNANVTGLDFGNTQKPWCEKLPVRQVLDPTSGQYPGNKGPDVVVRVDLGESVQDAVDNTGDANGDGYVIIAVSAKADGTLGGSASQKVAVWKDYGEAAPFALIGCSVTLTGGGADPAVWVKSTANAKNITVNGRTTDIFVMDLHGASSAVGVQADGAYRYLRNEYGTGSGVGIKVVGNNNTVHNGKGEDNTGDGVSVAGNGNKLTDTNAMSNGGNGFTVSGSSNQLLKLNAGERGTGNGGDGVLVVGAGNTLSEIKAYANGGDGIDVAGNTNTLTKNVAGDRTKGNAGSGIRVAGASNTLTENKASANGGDGFVIGGGGTSATANLLKNNVSNTGTSGSDLENVGAELRLTNWIKNNGGGNKIDGVTLPNAAKISAFPASGATMNYLVATAGE